MASLFFSYSHKDESLRDELDNHLSILRRQGIIDAWHDRRIPAGSEFNLEISNHLKNADVILLLVSSDFLASNYCYDIEMNYAMEMHKNRQAVVIPVILRPCDWHDTPFGELLAVPKDDKPVTKFLRMDEAFLEIATEIKKVVRMISSKELISNQEVKLKNYNGTLPSSRNLKITKKFSDQEKDRFLDDAFEYIANYFESSLVELRTRNPHIDYRYKRVDTQSFHTSIYIYGSSKTECMIFFRESLGFSRGISYSHKISVERNSFNELLSVDENGYSLYLKTFGIPMLKQKRDPLTFEEAAEYYWEMFIEPLQRS